MSPVRRLLRSAGWPLLLAAIGGVRPAAAQVVEGRVTDVLGQPVGRGFVVLVAEDGAEIARALTDGEGRFTIAAPGPGTYRLRSERIGYRAWTSPPASLRAGEAYRMNPEVEPLPVRLSAVEVEGTTECRVGPASEGSALLWEGVRVALSGASWSARQSVYRQTLNGYERDVDRSGRRVLAETNVIKSGIYDNPFSSLEPRRLADEGYIVDRADGTWYYAPDAAVLLDSTFLGRHCFRVVRDESQPGMVGLGFAPVPGQDGYDVEGTLWIDEGTAELHALDYRYTRIPHRIRDSRIGGRIEFLQLPSGAWIVRQWFIRTPRLRQDGVADRFSRAPPPRLVVDGYREIGGEVLEVTTLSRDPVYVAPMAVLTGIVVDSTRQGAPLEGATVRVSGSEYRALTDADGRFRLEAPLNGEYGVSIVHPRVDSLGVSAVETRVPLERSAERRVHLSVPSLPAVLEQHCGERHAPPERGVLVGTVRTAAAGRPVPGVRVTVSWQNFSIRRDLGGQIRTQDVDGYATTDDEGRYVLCDLPATGRPILLAASSEPDGGVPIGDRVRFSWDRESARVTVEGDGYHEDLYVPNPIWTRDLELAAGWTDGAEATGVVTIVGLIRDAQTTRGLSAAEIVLNGRRVASAGPNGTFRVPNSRVMIGENRVIVRRLGYERLEFVVRVNREDGELDIRAALRPCTESERRDPNACR